MADRDRHDSELRDAVKNFWPTLNADKLDLLVPPDSGRKSATILLEYLHSIKAESHCSDNKNDNDHDAKRRHSIG